MEIEQEERQIPIILRQVSDLGYQHRKKLIIIATVLAIIIIQVIEYFLPKNTNDI